jgi:hypothetical protein
MLKISAVALTALALAAPALATTSFTTVMNPPSSERGHAFILGQTYGGTFARAANGRDFSNGTITAQRLIDSGVAPPASLTTWTTGLPTDNQWVGPALTTLRVEAKYAAHNSTFGFFDDSGKKSGFQALFNTGTIGNNATVDIPEAFRFALRNNTTGKTFTSRTSDNVDGKVTFDHLVTYRITTASGAPLGGTPQYMLFWEDLRPSDCTDKDYNDAAIRVTVVPAPGSAALIACGGLLAARRRRR